MSAESIADGDAWSRSAPGLLRTLPTKCWAKVGRAERLGGIHRSARRVTAADEMPAPPICGDSGGRSGQLCPSGPMMTKVSLLPTMKNGCLGPTDCLSTFISRRFDDVRTTPSCIVPERPPLAGTQFSQSSV